MPEGVTMPRPTSPNVDAADLDGQCLELRRYGNTYRQIAAQLGISPANAHKRVTRGLDRTRREPGDALRELELERLDQLQVEATKVLAGNHVVIQGGKVVRDKQGEPYRDHGPTLAAIRTLLQVQERRARLLGLDAPTRVDARVLTIDELDRQIAELETLLGETADREGVDLYQRKHEQASKLVEDLAGQAGVDYHERQQVHDQVLIFWNAWKDNQRASRDVPGFIAAALDTAIMILALPAEQAEELASQVERFLLERAR
jgi:hypothetical protein